MPYREAFDLEFAERAAASFSASVVDEDTVSLTGPCPRCGTGMNVVVPSEMFFADRTRLLRRLLGRPGRQPSPPDQEVPMFCSCRAEHPGRPEGRTGCGAYWNLAVGGQQ
jgi:hypothetical protein